MHCSELYGCNLRGTLPDSIGAFTGLTRFDVHDNDLTGSIPVTVANWKALTFFRVQVNQFSGGVLPPLPFDQMRDGCYLLNHDQGGSNTFRCPWPQGATEVCQKCNASSSSSGCVPITNSDCTPCTGSSMKLPANQCAAWQDLFDSTQGNAWRFCNKSRTDPCSCRGGNSNHPGVIGPPVCDSANTTVTTM